MAEMTYTTDTSKVAASLQARAFGEMTPTERIKKVCQLSSHLRAMAREAIRRNHPDFDESQIQLKLIELSYGTEISDAVMHLLRERDGG